MVITKKMLLRRTGCLEKMAWEVSISAMCRKCLSVIATKRQQENCGTLVALSKVASRFSAVCGNISAPRDQARFGRRGTHDPGVSPRFAVSTSVFYGWNAKKSLSLVKKHATVEDRTAGLGQTP